MKKDSQYYMKSSFESNLYGNDSYTKFERNFDINGNDKGEDRVAGPSIRARLMP